MVLDLTRTGITCLLQCLIGGPSLTFSSIVLGNGDDAGGEEATAISNPLVTIGINEIVKEGNFVTLSGALNNNDITSGFRASEMGVMIQDPDDESKSLLFAYGYIPDEKAMYIPAITDRLFEITENVMVFVGSAENVSAVINDSLITVSKAEFEKHLNGKNPHGITKADIGLDKVPNVGTDDQTPNFEIAKELVQINAGEKMSVLFGKVAKAISSLITHLKNKDNPHGVTAETIEAAKKEHRHSTNDLTEGILGMARGGLGADNAEDARKTLGLDKVSNAAINDQTPTYTESSALTNIESEEKLSIAFGKIKKAITDLILHLKDTTKHITATERTAWNEVVEASEWETIGATATSVSIKLTEETSIHYDKKEISIECDNEILKEYSEFRWIIKKDSLLFRHGLPQSYADDPTCHVSLQLRSGSGSSNFHIAGELVEWLKEDSETEFSETYQFEKDYIFPREIPSIPVSYSIAEDGQSITFNGNLPTIKQFCLEVEMHGMPDTEGRFEGTIELQGRRL